MKKAGIVLDKYKTQFQIVYMIILALYPMLRVGQGLSVMDTTYSLSNFAFMSKMDGTWIVATYLANVLGSAMMHLPGGATMLGMNIYTSLVVSLTAVSVFIFLKRDIPSHLLFIGEFIALGLCWCPTTILYNYLTYLLFSLGALVLYRGVCGGRDDCFVAAGILLGLNVSTRFPNITEAALIVVVWYVGIIEKREFKRVMVQTLKCLGGYILGFGIPYVLIAIRFTSTAYSEMIKNLFAMTDKATDYKPTSMLSAIFADYLYAAKWIGLFCAGFIICALVWFALKIMIKEAKTVRLVLNLIVCLLVMCATIRVCYGQGMFSFRYYEYGSMYFWAVIFILISSVISLIYIFWPEQNRRPVNGVDLNVHHKKILGMMTIVIAYITCLGSNNGMYPSVNNLFVIAPYIVWVVYEWVAEGILAILDNNDKGATLRGALKYAFAIVASTVTLCVLIQSIGFHLKFAIQDGDDGQSRDSYITGFSRTNGICTTSVNAKALQELMEYVEENGTNVNEVLLYGDIPGLGYILNKESALSTFWPDLDSYTYAEWARDLKAVEGEVLSEVEVPYVITSVQVAAWESGDTEAINYFGIDTEKFGADDKLSDLIAFMRNTGYRQVFCNDKYSVYYLAD